VRRFATRGCRNDEDHAEPANGVSIDGAGPRRYQLRTSVLRQRRVGPDPHMMRPSAAHYIFFIRSFVSSPSTSRLINPPKFGRTLWR
jgi:hypothetical protein